MSTHWIRPLTNQEYMDYGINQMNCSRISYVMRVSSSRKLTEDDARKVFSKLYR